MVYLRLASRILVRNVLTKSSATSSCLRWTTAVASQRSLHCSNYDRKASTSILRTTKSADLVTGHPFTLPKRCYGGKPPYTLKTVQDRVMLLLQLFDKINPDKLTLDSHFMNDLGLDSLDHVEIMLKVEEEFVMEIPDADAEELTTPRKIIQYICDAEDVFE